MRICFTLLLQKARWAWFLAFRNAGNNIAIRSDMTVITTKSSTNVNAFLFIYFYPSRKKHVKIFFLPKLFLCQEEPIGQPTTI